jgi:hypothetical protein
MDALSLTPLLRVLPVLNSLVGDLASQVPLFYRSMTLPFHRSRRLVDSLLTYLINPGVHAVSSFLHPNYVTASPLKAFLKSVWTNSTHATSSTSQPTVLRIKPICSVGMVAFYTTLLVPTNSRVVFS